MVATDAAGNVERAVEAARRAPVASGPPKLPKALPRWAWALFDWQQSGRVGHAAATRRGAPDWYWRWAQWRAFPFHIRA